MMNRNIYPDNFAEQLKSRAGMKYCPANGFEGDLFTARWCEQCAVDMDTCDIMVATLFIDVRDERYPQQWQYNENGQPICTAFNEI